MTQQEQQSPLASQRARENASAHQQQKGRFGTWFPLSAKEGWSQWWASLSPAYTEHAVLSFIPYLQKPPTHTQTGSAPPSVNPSTFDLSTAPADRADPVQTSVSDPYGPRRWISQMVQLSGKDRALNEFSVERIGEPVENNLVMLHGYGAGLGFFYKNFEPLSREKGWKIYALDMLGMGRSTRPPFKIHAKDHQGKITEAENWFIDALEEWRVKRKIERFTLCGHSLGGYMAVAYALKYPGHLNKLLLVSPVGIPEDPYAVGADMPDQSASQTQSVADSAIAQEFADDSNPTTNPNNPNTAPKSLDATLKPATRRPLPRWLTYLWDSNISPFSLVRWSGPLGPRLVSSWTTRRFSHLPPTEAAALHDYAYSLFRQPGSGEYALAYVLAPGAFARSPLIRRIHALGRQWVDREAGKREDPYPTFFLYGDRDWMDVNGGHAARERIEAARARALRDAGADEDARRRDRGFARVVVVRDAGHHVYLDGAEEFNRIVRAEMQEVAEAERERAGRKGEGEGLEREGR